MNIDQFLNKWNGRILDYDGSYGGQCVDVYRQYCLEVLNVPQSKPVVGAADIWNTYLKEHFDRIENTPTGIPEKGDIIIWNKYAGGGFGHVAIFVEGDVNSFTSFDQNWPVGSVCHLQKHNYTNVLGWLRSKPKPQPDPVYVVTPSIDDDHKRAYQALEDWRKDPKNLDGPEGNFEGFVRRLISRDERYSKLAGDLSVCRNNLVEYQKRNSEVHTALEGLEEFETKFSNLFDQFKGWMSNLKSKLKF